MYKTRMESNVLLESQIERILTDVREMKSDVRSLRNDIDRLHSKMDLSKVTQLRKLDELMPICFVYLMLGMLVFGTLQLLFTPEGHPPRDRDPSSVETQIELPEK